METDSSRVDLHQEGGISPNVMSQWAEVKDPSHGMISIDMENSLSDLPQSTSISSSGNSLVKYETRSDHTG